MASTSPLTQIGIGSNSFKSIQSNKSKSLHDPSEIPGVIPLQISPSVTIPGIPAIIKHEVLSNRENILTEDAEGNICLWNIFTGRVEKQFKTIQNKDKDKDSGDGE